MSNFPNQQIKLIVLYVIIKKKKKTLQSHRGGMYNSTIVLSDKGKLVKSVDPRGQPGRLGTLILKARFYLVSQMRNKSLVSVSIQLFSLFPRQSSVVHV